MVDNKIKIVTAVIAIIAVIGITGIVLKSTTNTQRIVENKVTAQEEVTIIKVGGYFSGALRKAPIPLIADEVGYFNDTEIKIEEVETPPTPEVIAAISTGQIDAAHVQYTTIIRAIAKGVKIKTVLAAHDAASANFRYYVLEDSPIKSAKDLRGKKVGIGIAGSPKGSTPYIILMEYLRTANLSENDVDVLSIPPGQEELVLRNKQVDAVALMNNFDIGPAMERGGIRQLVSQFDILPKGTQHCGLIVSEKFIKDKPELLRDFIKGVSKAGDWERENPDKATELSAKLVKDNGVNPEPILKYVTPSDMTEHAAVRDSDIQWFIDRLVERGELKEGQIKPYDVYTNEFNPYYK